MEVSKSRISCGRLTKNLAPHIQSLSRRSSASDLKPHSAPTGTIPAETVVSYAVIKLEHYLVSGGIGDLLRGLKVAPHMTEVFGCEFDFDPESGKAVTVKSSVSFTEKTKFIYAINKGITGERLRANPYSVNDVVPPEDRRIPFRNMIYVGDGPSDIPCFSMIIANGGDGIGVTEKIAKGYELAKGKRTTTGPYSPDYRSGSDMRKTLEAAILDKAYGIYLELQRATK